MTSFSPQTKAALTELIDHYLRGVGEPFITPAEIHLLVYLLQEAGERLPVTLAPPIGKPIPSEITSMIRSMHGHFINVKNADNIKDDNEILPLPKGKELATNILSGEHVSRVKRISRTIEGFETPIGLELLILAYQLHKHNHTKNESTPPQQNQARFSDRQIRLAWDRMRSEGWIRISRLEHQR